LKERVLIATALETAGISNLFLSGGVLGALGYILLHFTASAIMSSVMYFLVPQRYKKAGGFKVLLLFTLFIGSLGVLGFAGSVALYLFMLKRKRPEPPVERISEEEVLSPEVEKRILGEATAEKLDDKIVLFLMKSVNPVAFRFLRNAVSSENDEVRLIAFSVIANMEKEIFGKINTLLNELEETQNETEKFRLMSSIAELYWELVFLNIADEELEGFYLSTALEYALASLEIKRDGKVLFLTGRILLKMGKLEEAEKFLEESLSQGFPPEKVVPYLMEVFFRKREFEKIFEIGKLVKGKVIPDIKASSIVRVWV